MAKQFDSINQELQDFIRNQKIFFVATGASEGRINLSPKGMDSFRVINANKIIWLNLTGSGNETAAHLLKNPRMTIMFCTFDEKPMILRLYGQAKTFHSRDEEFDTYSRQFPKNSGTRQIIEMKVNLVQTSCGFAVPLLDFKKERTILTNWANKKSEQEMQEYWEKKNTKSIDGFETGIFP